MKTLLRRWLARPQAPSGPLREAPFETDGDPWTFLSRLEGHSAPAACNICWWTGESFGGFHHCESAACPDCGSIARDRFLFHCFVLGTPAPRAGVRYRVLETSPRLGSEYRDAMGAWFDYRASDFDERAHRADLKLDLQAIDLEDDSIDVVLTPHVLEHVPNTSAALSELFRILSPGGRMYLQVPILQGWTAPPAVPEFHGDDTPVFWRFGFDLTQQLRDAGFRTRVLCAEGFYEMARLGATSWPDPVSTEFDLESILAGVEADDLAPCVDPDLTRRLGFHPTYMFLTWEAVKPSRTAAAS